MDSKCLIVLGMHRSGTSALSGALHLLGVNLGNSLIPADPNINPKGYWEHSVISGINESILRKLGYSWLDERALPEHWWKNPELKSLQTNLVRALKNDFAESELWAVKDPRICRLLPLWLEILKDIKCHPHFLIITRHPSEVALSLNKRNNIQPWKSSLLWLRYLLDSEYYSRNYPRIFLTYEQLLTNKESFLNHIAKEFSIKWPIEPSKIHAELDQFLDPSLHHHHQERTYPAHQHSYVNWTADTYKLINNNFSDFQDTHPTQLIKLEQAVRKHKDFLAQINQYLLIIENQRLQINTLNETRIIQEHRFEQEIQRIKSTVSWRITTPLRVLWNIYQKKNSGQRNDASAKE